MYFPMTTITIHSLLNIDRTEFNSLEDFLLSVFKVNDDWVIDFHELDQSDISDDLKIRIKDSLDKKSEYLTSVSSYDMETKQNLWK